METQQECKVEAKGSIKRMSLEGAMDSIPIKYGAQTAKPFELSMGFAHIPPQTPTAGTPNYLTLLPKCSPDGRIRDKRTLNLVVALDISRSMVDTLSQTSKGNQRRLALAKQALLLIYSKLRDSDSFGLVLFDNNAETRVKCERKSRISKVNIMKQIERVQTTSKETRLLVGFREGVRCLEQYLQEEDNKRENAVGCENRVVIITDMNDDMSDANQFIDGVSTSDIHITVVGMSDEFRPDTCRKLTQIKGFNYFCALQNGDLNKYVFQNFGYSFFPCLYDLQITLQSENIQQFKVHGTSDSDMVPKYNNGFGGSRKHIQGYVVTNIKTVFPSVLTFKEGHLMKRGGVILLQVEPVEETGRFGGFIGVSYRTIQGDVGREEYKVEWEYKADQQYYSQPQLEQIINTYRYIQGVNHATTLHPTQSLKHLQSLQPITPTHRQQQLNRLILRVKLSLQ